MFFNVDPISITKTMTLFFRYGQSISNSGDLVLSMMAWPSKWVVLTGTLTATIGAGLQALAGGSRQAQSQLDVCVRSPSLFPAGPDFVVSHFLALFIKP